MQNFTQPNEQHQNPNPAQVAQAGSTAAGTAATESLTHKGRNWFLACLAVAVVATGAGVGGYALNNDAGADTVESATPGDQPSEEAGAPTGSTDGTPIDEAPVEEAPADTNPVEEAPEGQAPESEAPTNEATAPVSVPEGETPVPGAAMTVQQANASVIRIEATGEFADPQFGMVEGTGTGSGFIISEDGIAVTNNHVVAGAAFLEVYIPGEDKPRNARVLGTSECSDLAVIDISGSGFPQVALNMNRPVVGTAVYAAGYPLSDPEFTLTKGIVSRSETRGDTPFSSVDGVLEHDARINPGNSGGPLFDEFGQVVGINYQGVPSTRQSFSITSGDALPIINQLRNGISVDSIGINGQVVDLGDRFGIYVSSVETGSMADKVGIIAGDVILELEDVAVSTDGTMGDYCDVLRTKGTDVPLDITIFRPTTDQVLFGTLNAESYLN